MSWLISCGIGGRIVPARVCTSVVGEVAYAVRWSVRRAISVPRRGRTTRSPPPCGHGVNQQFFVASSNLVAIERRFVDEAVRSDEVEQHWIGDQAHSWRLPSTGRLYATALNSEPEMITARTTLSCH